MWEELRGTDDKCSTEGSGSKIRPARGGILF